jgi:hypothetical protein
VTDENSPGTSEKRGRVHTIHLQPITLMPGGPTRFSRAGMSWFVAQLLFVDDDPQTKSELNERLSAEVDEAKGLLESDEQFAQFITNPTNHSDYVTTLSRQDPSSPRKWAALFAIWGLALLSADDSLDNDSRQLILWRLGKIRAMLLFTRHIEELAWRGYQNFRADVLSEALTAWDQSAKNEPEEYWQTFLEDQPYLISLIFPGPVAIHQGKAYVGGKRVDNTRGKIVDFLLEHSISGNAALLEIKRPATNLLTRTPYRGHDIYAPSSDLVGAVSQILTYRDTIVTENPSTLNVFVPSCVVLIGNYGGELDSDEKSRCFELYRSSLNGVSIVTYDELFSRLQKILDLLHAEQAG